MSLDLCCNIQMIGSEVGVNNMKAWINPALHEQLRLVSCKGAEPKTQMLETESRAAGKGYFILGLTRNTQTLDKYWRN